METRMSNISNVTLACDDDRQTGAHKVMEHAKYTIKYVSRHDENT